MVKSSKLLLIGILFCQSTTWADSSARPVFVNPVYEGADPWIVKHGPHYYYCKSEGDLGISIWKSDWLTDPGIKRLVWKCPRRGWNSRQLWAPELHHVGGKWYIYYAASDGRNENHRTGVLEAATDDPQGEYIDRGRVYTGDDVESGTHNRWSIDATPVIIDERLYLIWSGWPDERDVQHLYIAPMSNPYTASGNRVKLCENDTYVWERVDENLDQRGLHEAPQILQRAGRTWVVYSCSGSWEPSYKLGLLSLENGDDPLNPSNWHKHDQPVFAPTDETFGVGHCCFVPSPDGKEEWLVYHAKRSREHGWQRAVFMQPFKWTNDGVPDFRMPVAPGVPLPLPSGEPGPKPGDEFVDTFGSGNWDDWRYYGYNRYIWVEDETLSIGGHPRWGLVNHYRSGEKALVRGLEWSDFRAKVRLRFVAGERDGGILFRVQQPALGYDAQQGYFAGLIAGAQRVILGKTDGKTWTEIARASHAFEATDWNELSVEARGERIAVYINGKQAIETADAEYSCGLIGVRVVDTHALFDDFHVRKH